jgi:hypothetical protein
VEWQVETHTRRLRLLIRWNRRKKEFCYLVTKLPAKRYCLDMISRAYKWRWQVEVFQSQDIKFTRDAFFFLVGRNWLFFKGQYVVHFDRPIGMHHNLLHQ